MRALVLAAALRLWAPQGSQATAEEARHAFEAGDFGRVVELSSAAYKATGELSFLYAQAHAERFRGNCDVALGLYGRVLAADPTGEYAGFAQEGIRLCEREIEADPGSSASVPPPQRDGPSSRVAASVDGDNSGNADVSPRVAPARPRRDVLGVTLLATGGVAAVAGATMLVSADVGYRRADAADDEATHIESRERARVLTIAGAVTGGVGLVLLVGATARFVTLRRSQRATSVVLSPGGVALVGHF